MKITTFLLFVMFFQVSAGVFSQNRGLINLKAENESLKEILRLVENQSNYRFLYNSNNINVEQKKNINCQAKSINEVLDVLFNGTDIKYRSFEKTYVLFSEERGGNLPSGDILTSPLQQRTVSGKVTDSDGLPLPGVTVVIKGTTQGTVTNTDGSYSLGNVPENAILSFSFVGMKTQEIPVESQTTIDLIMASMSVGIEEVVAIGYGTLTKSDLTGSIGSISSEELTIKGTTSPIEALQGQVAGVNINATSGRTGTDFEIKIRGDNSLTGGNPLYVVDGMVTGGIQFLNPQDIERIDILKDASSTAIYGSRGSNGVVIVTTKLASNLKSNKPVISYSGYYGVRAPARLPDLMDGDEYWEYRQNAYLGAEYYSGADITLPEYNQEWVDARTNFAASPTLRNILAEKNYTDWQNVMTNNGYQQNHWLSVSAQGDNNMSYLFGIGYQTEKGILANEWMNRYNFKASINHEISDKWSVGANVNVAIAELEFGEGGNENIWDAFNLPPTVATYIPEGFDNAGELNLTPATFDGMQINGAYNPLITINNLRDNTHKLDLLGNIFLQYSPITDLHLKSTFSPYIEVEKRGTFQGSETTQRKLKDPAATLQEEDFFMYTWDNQLDYKKNFNDHELSFMALFSVSASRSETMYVAVENLPFESLWHNIGSAPDIKEVRSSFSKTSLISGLGRLNYSYQGKYLVTASFRTDASSKLAMGHRWANFPSVGAAWRASQEEFLQSINMLSNLKVRATFGYTGNNNIRPYSTQRYATLQKYYDFDGTVANGFSPSNFANANLTWEKTRELNLGVDFGFFGNRINGSIDVYDKLSTGLLLSRKLAFETGWNSVTANVGSVSNKGIEFMLNTVNISTKNLTWTTTFNFSKNINAIEELYGGDEDDLGNLWFIGKPVNVNYTYVFDGIWQADQVEEAKVYGQLEGQARAKDLDNNKVIDSKDRKIIGTPDPSWSGNFSTSLMYRGFDLNVSLFTQQGVQVFSEFHRTYTKFDERWRNKLNVNYYMVGNNITEARVSNEYPMPKNSGIYWAAEDMGFYKDASFVKVKNIALGYTFSPALLKKVDIKSLRLYMNVLNPFVFTDFDGYDPEWAGRSRHGGGISSITYQFGVNVKF
ncbi:TonB-dependent receptor [Mariniphaga sediminis]|jgi:TonB-linked SusC/RagA family outer membrane protein|nr:TonB-dependent receptor [Mariniphaga sediminis]